MEGEQTQKCDFVALIIFNINQFISKLSLASVVKQNKIIKNMKRIDHSKYFVAFIDLYSH